MNFAQKQYELGFRLLGNSQRFNTTNYFRSIDTAKSRPNQFPASPRKFFIKKNLQEPYKDIFVKKSNERFRLRLETLQSKPVIPKLNNEYIELEKIMKNNKERARQIYNRALSIENEKYTNRVFTQRPRIMAAKYLEKLYEENKEKFEKLKSPRRSIDKYDNYSTLPVKLPRIKDRRNTFHSRTEANLDTSDNELNNNSLELKDHGHKEISHQKQGHIEGQHREYNKLETSN